MSSTVTRRIFLKSGLTLGGAGALGGLLAACGGGSSSGGGGGGGGAIHIGGIIPFTGVETHNGLSMKYGVELAADEINAAKGLGGRKVQLTLKDDGGSVNQGVQMAQELITKNKVDALVGTLTSSVRAAVFDVAKRSKTLYMNPTFYEGGLCSPNYFSTGAPPNQTIEPLAAWAMKNLGKKVFFIGSDYSWGTGSVKAAKEAVLGNGGQVVGTPTFVPFGTTDFSTQIRAIQAASPDILWPFVAGQDGITFLKQLNDAGARAKVKIVADYIDELIVPALSPDIYTGIVNCSTYYMSLDNSANTTFLAAMRKKYGNDAKISSFGMNMYNNMKLLQEATQKAGTWDKQKVLSALASAKFDGPCGALEMNPNSHYATSNAYVAEIQSDGSFKVIQTEQQVPPKALCSL
jgi:ABC-type branched-subunit amino acid transport system substrate-binding protein